MVIFIVLLMTTLGAQAQSWQASASPSTNSLRGLCAVSDRVAWASGAQATILLTTNGGAAWKKITPPAGAETLDFRDIHAWDAQTAVIMSAGPGTKSRIYRTTDGGASWKLAHENKQEKGFFDGIAFWDRKRGILVGDPVDGRFTILTTTDGGATWQPGGMPTANEGEGAFAASGTSITVGKRGRVWFGTGGEKGARVFRSQDWGKTWQVAQTPVRHDSASSGIFSVAFLADGLRGFAIGGDYRKEDDGTAVMAVSTDGGRTWNGGSGIQAYRSVVATRGKIVLVAGPKGGEVSMDGGKSWRTLPPPGFHAASMTSRMAWASGSEGRLAILMVK